MALSFRLKLFPEILSGIMNTLRSRLGEGIDLNVGSVLRTLAEAAALQDADQYAQIGKLLDYFSLDLLRGDDVDRRALDFGTMFQIDLRRLAASQSKVLIAVRDITYDNAYAQLLDNVPAGSTSFSVGPGQGLLFPSAGRLILDIGTGYQEALFFTRSGDTFTLIASGVTQYGHLAAGSVTMTSIASKNTNVLSPGSTVVSLAAGTGAAFATSGKVILSRELATREIRNFTRVGDTLTLTPGTTNAHAIGSTMIQSTVNVDRTINSGTVVSIPATVVTPQVDYTLDETITLLDGDYQSETKLATSKLVGSATLAGGQQISIFQTPPFPTAVPFNPYAAYAGRDREDDLDYIQRIKDTLQSISGLTALSIATDITGAVDPDTGVSVGFAQLLDAVLPGVSQLFISDGSVTFAPLPVMVSGRETLISVASQGDRRAKFAGAPPLTVVQSPGLPTPAVPSIVQVGAAGITTYRYVLVALAGVGESPSASGVTFSGPATLTGLNLNRLTWQPIYGVTGWKVYRVLGGSTQGLIATLPAGTLTLDDTGLAGDASAAPTVNTTIANATAITPRLFRSLERGVATSVNPFWIEDNTKSWSVNQFAGMFVKTDDNQIVQITTNTNVRLNLLAPVTPSLGAYSIYDLSVAPMVPKSIDDLSPTQGDYIINDTTGDIELTVPLLQYDGVIAADDNNTSLGAYIKSSGLIAFIQKTLNGDDSDIQNFPGLKAPGTSIRTLAPSVLQPQLVVRALPSTGVMDTAYINAVKAAVQRAVNAVGIGQTVILARAIQQVMNDVPTTSDTEIISPKNNISVVAGQIARITATDITVV